MDTNRLSSVFSEIKNKHDLPLYIQKICEHISTDQNTFTRDQLTSILEHYHIPESISKIGLLNLILLYIEMCLVDDQLTKEEKRNIILLKIWAGIQEGDFYSYKRNEIGDIITYQLRRIYKDNFVSNDEAIFKVDLQQIFDLSFDELNEYVKEEALLSLKQGGNIADLDCVFTPKEYFAIKGAI